MYSLMAFLNIEIYYSNSNLMPFSNLSPFWFRILFMYGPVVWVAVQSVLSPPIWWTGNKSYTTSWFWWTSPKYSRLIFLYLNQFGQPHRYPNLHNISSRKFKSPLPLSLYPQKVVTVPLIGSFQVTLKTCHEGNFHDDVALRNQRFFRLWTFKLV